MGYRLCHNRAAPVNVVNTQASGLASQAINACLSTLLQRKVWPVLLQQPGDEPLRVWTLGCSTGQEAYSIAMTFVEAAAKAPRMRKLQVFATDLSDALLDKTRHGLYAKSVAQDLSPERLRRLTWPLRARRDDGQQ